MSIRICQATGLIAGAGGFCNEICSPGSLLDKSHRYTFEPVGLAAIARKTSGQRVPNRLIHGKGEVMKEYLILLAVIGVWILLQRLILPKMGIQT